jgi:hypothetical protein
MLIEEKIQNEIESIMDSGSDVEYTIKLLKETKEEILRLKKECNRFSDRDCSASIQMCYSTDDDPFNTESLKIVDVGVSDNIYIVESKLLQETLLENKKLKAKAKYTSGNSSGEYLWETEEPLSTNGDTMTDFIDNHMQGYFGEVLEVVYDDGTYIEVQNDDGIGYGINSSGNGDFCNHKVLIEILT